MNLKRKTILFIFNINIVSSLSLFYNISCDHDFQIVMWISLSHGIQGTDMTTIRHKSFFLEVTHDMCKMA